MTKSIMTKTTKFFLACVLVLGGFSANVTNAFAQETDSSDSVVEITSDSAKELVAELVLEMEVTTSNTTTTLISSLMSETVVRAQEDTPAAFAAFALDQAVIDAQTAANETLTQLVAAMDAAVDASIHMTDEQKLVEKETILMLAGIYTFAIDASTTVEEVNVLVLEITELTSVVVDALAVLDVAKTDAIAKLDAKLATTKDAINALTSLSLEEKDAYLYEAQSNYDLALEYILIASTPQYVQDILGATVEIFDLIIWASNFDDRVNAINVRLTQAHDVINNDTRLTYEQANALIESMNTIVDKANIDMEAAMTIEQLDAILNTAIVELNVILDNILYASVEISKSVDKTTAYVGDILTYTLTIKNTGAVEISTLKLRETYNPEFVSMAIESLSRDAFVVGVGDLGSFGGQLRTIMPNETVNVTFQVVVLEGALNQAITNSFTVTSTQLAPETVISNTVVTNVIDTPVLTPGDGTVLPNTGLDNSSLFLSVSALLVGALTLVLALKRNRNV